MIPFEAPVLVAEDNHLTRLLIERCLGKIGFKSITVADDGLRAWESFQRAAKTGYPFRIIVSDWAMPGMTGLELLRAVRSHETAKSTPFIMITASVEKPQILEAIKAGVTGYVSKPFTVEKLHEQIVSAFNSAPRKTGT